MSEHIEISVRSNVDAINARVVHEGLVAMVNESMAGAEAYLRADRADHTRSGATERAIHRDAADSVAGLVEAKLGVLPVAPTNDRPTHGRYRHEQAPIFEDAGTHSPIFATRPGGLMVNKSEGIFNRREVRGQAPQGFMFRTFAMAQLLMRSDPQLEIALDAMAAAAATQLPEVER